jgi:hypothetical protein
MTNRAIRSAGVALLAITVAACSSGAASSTPTPIPTASPTPTVAATSSASAGPSLDLPRNAKELEALLPDSIGGATLTKFSMKGSDFIQQGQVDPQLKSWLDSLGKSLDDVSVAYAFDITGASQTGIFAFRVNGVDHTTLLNGLKTAMEQGSSEATNWTSTNIGGKSGVFAGTSDSGTTYLYGTADLVFFVVAKDKTTAADALSQLP